MLVLDGFRSYSHALSENRLSLLGSGLLGAALLAPFYLPVFSAIAGVIVSGTAGAALLKGTVPTTMRGYRFTEDLARRDGSLERLAEEHPHMGDYYCSQAGANAAARRVGCALPFPNPNERFLEMACPRLYERRKRSGAVYPHLL